MKKPFLILCLMLIALCLYPKSTFALSCVELPTGEEAYNKYDGIVEAQVEKISRSGNENIVNLKVIRSFKDIEERSLSVSEDVTWGALNGPSEKGETYLFYLNKIEDSWENPLCSPSMKVAEATEELKYLGAKEIVLKDAQGTDQSEGTKGKDGIEGAEGSKPGTSLIGSSTDKSTSIFGTYSWLFISIGVILLCLIIYGILRKRKTK